jgi:peptidase M28-like protein
MLVPHRNPWRFVGLLIGVCLPTAHAEEAPPVWGSPIQAQHVRPHVEFLASEKLAGRAGPEAAEAAEYVRKQFELLRLKPLFANGSFEQPVPGTGIDNDKPADLENGGATKNEPRIVGRNVGAWIEGSDMRRRDELIVLGAHFDHLGVRHGKMFRGADDNASGTAMMLEVARQLAQSKHRPKRGVVFVGFDLEEQLLWGSRWFVAHPPWPIERVKLFITADMIGRSLGDLPLPTVFVMGSEHAPQLKKTLDDVGAPRGLEVARLGVDLVGVRSDYGPFWSEKIPFLFFSTGQHPDYHSPRDVPERLDFDKVARVSNLILELVRTVADAETTPTWIDDVSPDLDEVRAVHRITTLLLDAEGSRRFTDLQKLIVTQAQTKCRQILDRGQMTTDERKWLTRTSQLMLLSVF